MKANELRIGNKVQSCLTGEIVEIDWLALKHLEDGNVQAAGYDNSCVYKPIPITEEWLKRLGFQYSESKEWLILKYRVVTFDTDESVGFSIVYASVEGYKFGFAQTVHQLQNLYWCLTGEELHS